MSSLSMQNSGLGNNWLQISDEEKSNLWRLQDGRNYHNRLPQAVMWAYAPTQMWPNSRMTSGDPSVLLCMFGQDSQQTGIFEPMGLGFGGKSRPYFIRGICKDESGNPLGGAVVYAVRVSDNMMVGSAACDDRGVFEVPTLDTTPHFVHSFYASGSLAGRSVNTLTPVL